MEEKNNLEKLNVAIQAHRQRKRILLYLAIAWLSMLMAMKFQRNEKTAKFSLETFQSQVRCIKDRMKPSSMSEKSGHIMLHVVRCAIWYHLYNLKNVKNTDGGVLIVVKLQAPVSQYPIF